MMTREQYLLIKLAEEATEVAQIALKTAQFGQLEVMPGQPLNNAERTHLELHDLMAHIEMLNEECDFGYVKNQHHVDAKKLKVAKFSAFSVGLGMVQPREEQQ